MIGARFKERSRDEWAAAFDGTDACVAPVLTWSEAREHPHLAARETFAVRDGVTQPGPAPRLSRTPVRLADPPGPIGAETRAVLTECGVPDVETLLSTGAAVQA